jgi:hypothetical protein
LKSRFTVFAFLLLFAFNVSAQSFIYYPFNSLFGISTNPNNRLWLDAKIQTNSYFSSLSTELSPEINLNNNPKGKFYLGAGFKLNYLNLIEKNNILDGYFFNAGVRSAPFEKYKKVQIVFELSPYVGRKFDIGIFRAHLGIGYNFSK